MKNIIIKLLFLIIIGISIGSYINTSNKVEQLNKDIKQLYHYVDSIEYCNQLDKDALGTYIPDDINTETVTKDTAEYNANNN